MSPFNLIQIILRKKEKSEIISNFINTLITNQQSRISPLFKITESLTTILKDNLKRSTIERLIL